MIQVQLLAANGVVAITKRGVELTSVEQWGTVAPPKRSIQWSEGRSAMEVARVWLDASDQLPQEVARAIERHTAFGSVQRWHAEPEVALYFDRFPGEPRNSDLVVEASDEKGKFLLAVEAKADEAFCKSTAEALADALERSLVNLRSNGLYRIQQLAAAILGPRQTGDPATKRIRYQLLTATAGAICEAELRNIGRSVLLIQEFITDKTLDRKHLANAKDLDAFVHRISHGEVREIPLENLIGPIRLPGQPLFSDTVEFFVGKVSRNIRIR